MKFEVWTGEKERKVCSGQRESRHNGCVCMTYNKEVLLGS